MRAEGAAAETMRMRIYLLRAFDKPIDQVTHDDIIAVLNSRQHSANTRAAYVGRLKAMFTDLIRLGIVDIDPMVKIKTPKTPRRSPRPLPAHELAALESITEERAYAWTILGAYAGLRIGEVCSITGTALQDGVHGPVVRITGKGNVTADIPAHRKVVAVLEPYSGLDEPIWPMWPSSMLRAWRAAAAEVGVTGRTFHQLRHTYCTRLAQAGVPLLVVAEVARHASVATTQKYTAVASDAGMLAVAGL
jgi:integrase/recombinase XerC